MADQSINFRITGDASNLNSALGSVGKKIGSTMKTVGVAVTAIGVATAGLVYKFAEAGANVEEMQNKFDVVFSGMTEEVEAWASEFASAIGRNKNEIKGYLADNQNMFVGMGMTREAGAEMSEQLVQTALDLASFNNLNDDEAVEKMSKAIMGETESAKGLGAVLNENTRAMAMEVLGYEGKFSALTEAQKMEVNYQAILMQSTDAIGDAERSAGSYTGQMKALTSKIQELKENIGMALLPVMTDLIGRFSGAIDTAVNFYKTMKDNGSIDNLRGKMEQVITTIKDVIKFVIELGNSFIQFYYDNEKLFQDIFNTIKNTLTDIWNIIKQVWQDIQVLWDLYGDNIMQIVNTVWNAIKGIIESVMYVIKGVINIVMGILQGDWSRAWEGIKQVFTGAFKYIETMVNWYMGLLQNAINLGATAIKNIFGGMWNSIKASFKTSLNWIVGKVNSFIGSINNKLSGGVGGKVLGAIGLSMPKIPSIPKLAIGGIVTKSTFANIGEAGAEAVVPLTNKSKVKPFANAVANSMNMDGGIGGDTNVTVYLDSKVIARTVGNRMVKDLRLMSSTSS